MVLKDYTKIELMTSQEMGFDCFGQCGSRWDPLNERRSIPDNFAALIWVRDLSEEAEFCSRNTRLAHYLGILLHEMLHAHYSIYIYPCSRECRKSGKLTVDGRIGHAQLWLEAAIAIERATIPLLRMSLDLGLHNAIWDEYGDNCKTSAPQEVLSALEPLEQEEFHWSEFLNMENLNERGFDIDTSMIGTRQNRRTSAARNKWIAQVRRSKVYIGSLVILNVLPPSGTIHYTVNSIAQPMRGTCPRYISNI
jgi:hypothetical protein